MARARAEHAADRAAGIARFGGRFGAPDYSDIYWKSAGMQIEWARREDRLGSYGAVCAYLQRHAVELALQDLHREATTIHQDVLDNGGYDRVPVLPYPRGHKLKTLYRQTADALARLELPMPSQFAVLVEALTRLERKDETRLRYPTGTDGRPSFSKRVAPPIAKWQHLLDELHEQHLDCRDDFWDEPRDQWKLGEELYVSIATID